MLKLKQIFFILILFSKAIFAIDVKLQFSDNYDVKDSSGNYVVYLREPFEIDVIVSGGGENNIKPKIEGLENFNIFGNSLSRHFSFINNKTLSQLFFKYTLDAAQEGVFSLGPAIVEVDGKKIKSNVIKIRVEEYKKENLSKGVQKQRGRISSRYFCELISNKKEVVLGEPILISAKVFFTNPKAKISIELPDLSEFVSEEIDQEIQNREVVEGITFHTIEKRFVLIPLTKGSKVIAPFRVLYREPVQSGPVGLSFWDVGDIFGPKYKEKLIASNKLTLNVNDLPPSSSSADAVGKFNSFKASVDSDEVFENEPITFSLEIEGEGNFQQIEVPKLNLEDYFKYYDSNANLKKDVQKGFLYGSKKFEYVLQISKVGEIEIPAQKFTYFDPKTKQYEILTSNSIIVKVKPSKNVGEQGVSSISKKEDDQGSNLEDTPAYDKDISFIEEKAERKEGKQSKNIPLWLFIILLFLPSLLFLKTNIISFFEKRIRFFKPKDQLYVIKKRLKQLRERDRIEDLYTLFLDFFAKEFNISRSEVSQELIYEKLESLGWPQVQKKEFLDYLNICASLSFSGIQSGQEDKLLILREAEKWVLRLYRRN
jgi:hypothetical protein